MPALAPLKFTLYDLETFEPRGDYICNFVPLKYLKLAIRLYNSPVNINQDALIGLIVALFEYQFSADELKRCSEEGDRVLLLQEIVLRAGSFLTISAEASEAGEGTADGSAGGTQYKLEDEDWIVALEISLANAFNWSLKDIDETDIETLMPFVARFVGNDEKKEVKKKVFVDQVPWL
jgi:hypothetical protein